MVQPNKNNETIKLCFICKNYLIVYKQKLDLLFEFLKFKINMGFKNGDHPIGWFN